MKAVLLQFFCTMLVVTAWQRSMAQAPGAGYCIGFNGSTQYLAVQDHPSLRPNGGITIEAWVFPYTLGAQATDQTIVGKDNYNFLGPVGYTLRIGGGGVFFGYAPFTLTAPNTITTSNWQHLAATLDGTTAKIYVDGHLVATGQAGGSITHAMDSLLLARSPNTLGAAPFNGELDEVRVWSTALDSTTIRQWMCQKLRPSHPNYAQLSGYWRIDNGTGTLASDLGPNGLDAHAVAAPMWGWSGAPIGDTSIQVYHGPYDMLMPSPFGDSLHIDNVSGNPTAIHMYRVDETPNFLGLPNGFTGMDTSHYYAVHMVGGFLPYYDAELSYAGNGYIANGQECYASLLGRPSGNWLLWGNLACHQDPAQRKVSVHMPRHQFILARQVSRIEMVPLHPTDFCPGDSAQIIAGVADSYQWWWNGNPIPGANGDSLWVYNAGEYVLEASDSGCTYFDTILVNVSQTQAMLSLSDVCLNDSAQLLSGGLPAGGTYIGPGIQNNVLDPTVAGAGTHTVSYHFVDSIGCLSSDTAQMTVHGLPGSSLTPQPLSPCELAPPIDLIPAWAPNPAGGNFFGPGVVGNQFIPSLVGPGQYDIGYTLTNAQGCSDTAWASITVLPSPMPASISQLGDSLIANTGLAFQWYDSTTGLPIPGATSNVFVPTASGTYYVIIMDPNGCPSAPSNAITVTIVQVGDPGWVDVRVFPNPNHGDFRVRFPEGVGANNIQLLNPLGQSVNLTLRQEGSEVLVHSSQVAPGLYFLRMEINGVRHTHKVEIR